MDLLGISGKSNVGKSTFFSSATLQDVEISNRIFVTLKPNRGIGYIRAKCPCQELGVKCNPRNSTCIDGLRYIQVELLDLPGLVPGAFKGKGLGNEFLSHVVQAKALIHILDVSGLTDMDGNFIGAQKYNPSDDVLSFEKELSYWIFGILKRDWKNIGKKMKKGKPEDILQEKLAGFGIKKEDIKKALKNKNIEKDEELLEFCGSVRKISKPILLAANKIDLPSSDINLRKLRKEFPERIIIPCCSEAELALRRAKERGLIDYVPGGGSFKLKKEPGKRRKKALEFISNLLAKYGSTGVQECLDRAFFELLNYIVVYPVENEKKFSDKKGNVLPDAFLVKKGTTPRDLAFKVHTDIGKKFIGAINAKTGKKISSEEELEDGSIIKILI